MLNSMLRSHKDMNVLLPFGNQMWQWKTHHSFRLSHLNVPVMEGFPATMTPDSHGVLLRTWWWHTQMPGASQIPVASWPPTLENLWIPFTVPSPIGMAYRNGVSEWWSMEFDDKSLLRMVIFFFFCFVAMLYNNYIYVINQANLVNCSIFVHLCSTASLLSSKRNMNAWSPPWIWMWHGTSRNLKQDQIFDNSIGTSCPRPQKKLGCVRFSGPTGLHRLIFVSMVHRCAWLRLVCSAFHRSGGGAGRCGAAWRHGSPAQARTGWRYWNNTYETAAEN